MNRIFFAGYWLFCYLSFLVAFVYLLGFIGNRYSFSTIDSGLQIPFREALWIDIGLLLLFFAQHSIMARGWFKRAWRRWMPEEMERSTYVLAVSLILFLIYVKWEPMPELVWNIQHPLGRLLLVSLFWLGWTIVIVSSFLNGHWDLMGLRQAWRGREELTPLRTPGPYRWVRHPMMVGTLLGLWATPGMSRGHLLFAAANLLYVVVAVRWEERDLVRAHGEEYTRYQRTVPRFCQLRWGGNTPD